MFDVIVIGAGPAGMSAAVTLYSAGASVLVLDDQSTPGGQIYRALSLRESGQAAWLGASYQQGRPLIQAFLQAASTSADQSIQSESNESSHDHNEHVQSSQAGDPAHQANTFSHAGTAGELVYRPRSSVWRVDPDRVVCYSRDGKSWRVSAKQIIIASGAIERTMPMQGWTLPGVMTVGAGQILMKTADLLPRELVLVGCGPLLYLYASQLIAAGAAPLAVVETQSLSNYVKAAGKLQAWAFGWRKLYQGLGYLAALRKSGVARYLAASDLEIRGHTAVEGLSFRRRGKLHHLDCQLVMTHQGVVPDTQITRSLRLPHRWNERRYCFEVDSAVDGQCDLPGIHVIGDGRRVGGAEIAAYSGYRCARNICRQAGLQVQPDNHQLMATITTTRPRGDYRVQPFLDALYAPAKFSRLPSDNVTVCRCEEVTAGDIRQMALNGCSGPNQTKAFSRCGMGPCQGRVCGLHVTEILSQCLASDPQQTGYFKVRAPLKPLSLSELANLDQ